MRVERYAMTFAARDAYLVFVHCEECKGDGSRKIENGCYETCPDCKGKGGTWENINEETGDE